SGNVADTGSLARRRHSGSHAASAHSVAGGPKLEEPFGFIFSEIRELSGISLALSALAARTQATAMCRRQERDMSLVKRVITALLLTGAAALLLASSTLAQERVGVVTTIEGLATVARVSLPEPRPLQFKDELFLRDR